MSGPPRLPLPRPQHSQNEADKLPLSTDELHFIRDAKNTNFSLLEEMFGSRGGQSDQFIGNGDGKCDNSGCNYRSFVGDSDGETRDSSR